MQRHHLQKLSREELIREAERAGVPRPRVLTTSELVDEILKRTAGSERDRNRARGWLGRARDLLATVVEKGLHLPDAAAAIRNGPKGWPPPPPPLATVTLAEIYAAQGHLERAVSVLDEVLEREPEHQEARELREKLMAQIARGPKAPSDRPASQSAAAEQEAADPPADQDERAGAEEEEEVEEEEGGGAVDALRSAPQTPLVPAASQPSAPGHSQPPPASAVPPEEPAKEAAPSREAAAAPAAASDEAPTTAASAAASDEAPTTAASALDRTGEALAEAAAAEPSETAAEPAPAEPAAAEPAVAEALAADAAAAALPERYDVDEVVALAVDPSTFYVYWEVRPTTFAHMVATEPKGSLVLRVMAVTPGWEGPIVETRDVHIDALFGDHFIHHVRPRADVRVSIGWSAEGRFDPIAVGAEVSAPRAFVAAGAPAPRGMPLDLSEGPRGSRELRLPPAHFAFVARAGERAADRLAAGLVPRPISGTTMEDAPLPGGAGTGPASWIWAPAGAAEGDADLPLTFGPTGATALSDTGEPTVVRWGGASEQGTRFGGASERAPRFGGASENAPRWGGASATPAR